MSRSDSDAWRGTVDVGDCRIYVAVDGLHGAPHLMLSNSLGSDLSMWDPQLAAFAERFRVIRYDSRGHGKSGAPHGPYTMDRLGRDAVGVLDHLKIEKTNWCGLSMGGMVGQWLGANAPSRVDKLILSNTTSYYADKQSWTNRIEFVRANGIQAMALPSMERWFSAIADGVQPSNEGRGYVLRRILRRAVRYGRTLGFHEPFFHKLVDVLADTMGDVFPEIRAKKKHVQEVIRTEEEAFNKTLDKGIELFGEAVEIYRTKEVAWNAVRNPNAANLGHSPAYARLPDEPKEIKSIDSNQVTGLFAFKLYDTYGFPLDLTELMARERGLTVDKEGFEKLMEEQRARARAAQKKEVISLSQIETTTPTKFVGYEKLETPAKVLEVVSLKDKTAVILDTSACYAEMGGQVGDTGEILLGPVAADVSRRTSSVSADSRPRLRITNTQKSGDTWLHFVGGGDAPVAGSEVTLNVDATRRNAIQRHHTVTHLLHWALHEVVSREASQKGSFVGPDKLTFDFNSAPLTPQQVADVEKLVNERIVENASVSWTEVPYANIKSRKDVRQFFGEKYGDTVRVLQIGGERGKLNGYSMELCGGTHVRATGEIGLFRIVGEIGDCGRCPAH